jgi:hypothetical protein
MWHVCWESELWSQQSRPLQGSSSANISKATRSRDDGRAYTQQKDTSRPRWQGRHATVEELWEAVFSVVPCGGYIWRLETQTSLSRKSSESAVSSWETDASEIVADGRSLWRCGKWRSFHCCKLLRSNFCLVVRQSPASKDVNMETEEFTAWQAVTRRLVKTQRTEKT